MDIFEAFYSNEVKDFISFAVLICLSSLCGAIKFSNKKILNIIIFLVLSLGLFYCTKLIIGETSYLPNLFAFIVFSILFISDYRGENKVSGRKNIDAITLPVLSGTSKKRLEFYYYYSNFLVYGGAGSGKTKSIGKWLLEEYIRLGFAGFIYDFKDVDYTRTAYNLIKKHDYKGGFYYINFDVPERSYRFNPLKVVTDTTMLIQLMEDMLLSMQAKDAKQDEWFTGALGILRGVAYRMFDEYREYCTIPHILNLIMKASARELTLFLEMNSISEMMAGAFIKSADSEKTQASYLSTLNNMIATIATDTNINWVLSGDDFDFNLIDPKNPKMFAISNNFSKNSIYSPVIAMLISISSRQFTMQNKVPFVYFLDEMTTVKVKNFETLPSVLREYKAAFVLLTQSGAKLENLYGKLDRSSVEANFGNMFLGRTKDVEALKYYPLFFGKEEKERRSRSAGKSGSSANSSVTISSQKEDIYQGRDFSDLEPGEFIGSATRANVKEFKVKFKMFEMEEDELPKVTEIEDNAVIKNYAKIMNEVDAILTGEV